MAALEGSAGRRELVEAAQYNEGDRAATMSVDGEDRESEDHAVRTDVELGVHAFSESRGDVVPQARFTEFVICLLFWFGFELAQ